MRSMLTVVAVSGVGSSGKAKCWGLQVDDLGCLHLIQLFLQSLEQIKIGKGGVSALLQHFPKRMVFGRKKDSCVHQLDTERQSHTHRVFSERATSND